jgi:hypothetical protein
MDNMTVGGVSPNSGASDSTVTLAPDKAITTDPWTEKYTYTNVDNDGWGEIVRKEETQPEAIALSPALQLAALLRSAQYWEEVEGAVEEINPQVKKEAWALLTGEEKGRLNSLKAIALLPPVEIEPQATKAAVDDQAPQLLQQDTVGTATQVEEEMQLHTFKVGDRVDWDDCPSPMSGQSPFVIEEIEGATAKLEYFVPRAPLSELRLTK